MTTGKGAASPPAVLLALRFLEEPLKIIHLTRPWREHAPWHDESCPATTARDRRSNAGEQENSGGISFAVRH
jgi:hypothetical protein